MFKGIGVFLALYNFLVLANSYDEMSELPTLTFLLNYKSWVLWGVEFVFIALLVLSPKLVGRKVGLSNKNYTLVAYTILTLLFAYFSALSISEVGRLNFAVLVNHGLLSALIILTLKELFRILLSGLLLFSLVYFVRLSELNFELDFQFMRYVVCLLFSYAIGFLLVEENNRYIDLRKRVLTTNIELRHNQDKLEILNRKLEQQALVDKLTGLNNRHAFDEVYDKEWERAKRRSSRLGLLLVDVDHFKLLNDSQGHPAGDRALELLGSLIKQSLRNSSDFSARIGGEEFALLLPDTDLDGSISVANKLILSLRHLGFKHSSSTGEYLTVSIGCNVVYPNSAINQNSLMLEADKALYKSKNNGRNRVECA